MILLIVVPYSTISLWYYTGLWYDRLGKVYHRLQLSSHLEKNLAKNQNAKNLIVRQQLTKEQNQKVKCCLPHLFDILRILVFWPNFFLNEYLQL